MPYAQLAYVLGKSAKSTDTAEIKALEQRLIDGIKARDVWLRRVTGNKATKSITIIT